MTYDELCQKLGEPTTEKKVLGTLGLRFDTFPCGCVRIVRMGGFPPHFKEGKVILGCEVTFHACSIHEADFEGIEVE